MQLGCRSLQKETNITDRTCTCSSTCIYTRPTMGFRRLLQLRLIDHQLIDLDTWDVNGHLQYK